MEFSQSQKPFFSLLQLDLCRFIKKRGYMGEFKNFVLNYRKHEMNKDETLVPSNTILDVIHKYVCADQWLYEVVQAKEGSYVIRICEEGIETMYCKVANNASFCEFAVSENDCFVFLRQHKVSNIVDFIFSGYVSESEYVILSRAVKKQTIHSMARVYDKLMLEIDQFVDKTTTEIIFNDTDYYQQLMYIKHNISSFPDAQLADSVLDYINGYIEKNDGAKVQYSYYFGDCRVENCAYYEGNVHWYDFQRGKFTYPSYMDKYHLICLFVDFDANILIKLLPTFEWYDTNCFAEFMIDFFGRFISKNNERAQKHREWFLDSYRRLWNKMILQG